MTVSAIFISYNGRADLETALPSLRAQTVASEIEIIVVDNGSTDDTSEWVGRQPGLTLVKLPRNRGYAGGIAAGIKAATGAHLIQLNTDLQFDPTAIERMLGAIDVSRSRELVSCRFRTVDGKVQPYSYALPSLLHLPAHLVGGRGMAKRLSVLARLSAPLSDYLDTTPGNGVREVDVLSGACMLYTRGVIERIGPADERIFFGPDDWDFCARARKAGYRLGLVEAPLVTHVGGATSRREHGRPYHWVFYQGWVYYHRKQQGRLGVLALGLLVVGAMPIQMLRAALRAGSSDRPADLRLMARIVGECVRWLLRPLPSQG
jgi:GT2 family glycosyltransferase